MLVPEIKRGLFDASCQILSRIITLRFLQLFKIISTLSLVNPFRFTKYSRRSRVNFLVITSMQSSLKPILLYSKCRVSISGQLRTKNEMPLNVTRGQCVRCSSRNSGSAIVISDASDMSRQQYLSIRKPSIVSKR